LAAQPGVRRPDSRGPSQAGRASGAEDAAVSVAESVANGAPARLSIVPPDASDAARARSSIVRIASVSHPEHGGSTHSAAAATDAAASSATKPTAPGPWADPALALAGRLAGAAPASVITQAMAAAPAVAADRVALEAIDRITITTAGGVPGLESRIDDPVLGTIRIVVSARLGETVRAEIVARDPAAARELASGIDRALAGGAALPGNVDLHVRAESAAPAARADAHLGAGGGRGSHAGPQGQPFADASTAGGDRPAGRDGDPSASLRAQAPTPQESRGRGRAAPPVAASVSPGSVHPGSALDVRA
jgi:hypothetical protein